MPSRWLETCAATRPTPSGITNAIYPGNNNAAQRSLRPLVSIRKISGGTRPPRALRPR